jgi:sugar phosphate isomerase/epimerase
MSDSEPQIYLGTMLMEHNRWWNKDDSSPTFRVSDWSQRAADDGFDGFELWQNHGLMADREEHERLRAGPTPVSIFNAYDRCETDTLPIRKQIADLANFLGSEGMKYNFGKDPEKDEIYIKNVQEWKAMFPEEFRFLCECHSGSMVEVPEEGAKVFSKLGGSGYEVIVHGIHDNEDGIRERFHYYGNRITHIHANLSMHGLISEEDLRTRLAVLKDLGFSGTYTIEFVEGVRNETPVPIEDLYRNAVRDMKLLRKYLKEG